jgi:pSer/pThr/pTyr-binding forkhead associated (FHA) protein
MKLVTVGSSPNNTIVINDSQVAASHLQIVHDDTGKFHLTAFDSGADTFVNGQKISGAVILQPSDMVKIGTHTLPGVTYFETSAQQSVIINNTITHEARVKPVDKRPTAAWGVLAFILSFGSLLMIPGYISMICGIISIVCKTKARGLGIAGIVISCIGLYIAYTSVL